MNSVIYITPHSLVSRSSALCGNEPVAPMTDDSRAPTHPSGYWGMNFPTPSVYLVGGALSSWQFDPRRSQKPSLAVRREASAPQVTDQVGNRHVPRCRSIRCPQIRWMRRSATRSMFYGLRAPEALFSTDLPWSLHGHDDDGQTPLFLDFKLVCKVLRIIRVVAFVSSDGSTCRCPDEDPMR